MQKIEIERFLIGHLISNPNDQKIISRSLIGEDFTVQVHREIFEHVQAAVSLQIIADVSYLISKGYNEQSLFNLSSSLPLVTHENNFSFWIREIRECTILRKISENCSNANKSIAEGESSEKVLNELTAKNIEVRKLSLNIQGLTNAEIIEQMEQSIERAKNNSGMSGIPLFHINELDKNLSGGEESDLIIVAGRPGMGKSVLAVNIALEAIRKGKRLILWSLEMSAVQYAQRIISALSEAPFNEIRNGSVKDEHLREAKKLFIDSKVKIIEKSGVTIEQIYNTLLGEHEKESIDIVCVDHLGLIQGAGKRYERVSHNSNYSKIIAKELKVPVIMLNQLSRAVETRGGMKEPQLSDLRDSGTIEEDADKVLFVHRPSYYDIDGTDQIIIAKNRSGITGSIDVLFDLDDMLFKSLDSGFSDKEIDNIFSPNYSQEVFDL